MKYATIFISLIVLCSCTGSDSAKQPDHAPSLRLRNLALAYIESGMMNEATAKLAELESLMPNEAFVFANQGLVALRNNELEIAQQLLNKAATLSPNTPAIALIQSQVAMLEGHFDEAKTILIQAIDVHDGNMHLRWELAKLLRGDPNQIPQLEVIVKHMPDNIVARLALIKAIIQEERLDDALHHMLVLQKQGILVDEQSIGLFNGAIDQLEAENARVARAQVIGLDNVLKPTRAWQHSLLEVAGPPGTIGHPVRYFLNAPTLIAAKANAVPVSFTKVKESVLEGGFQRVLLVESPTQSKLITVTDQRATMIVPIDWNNDRTLEVVVGTEDGRVYIEGGTELKIGRASCRERV